MNSSQTRKTHLWSGGKSFTLFLIENERLNVKFCSKIMWVFCKLHVGKAYNHVNCNSPFNFINQHGFGEKWRT